MSSSLLARGLLVGLALSTLAVPAALADDPPPTTTGTTSAATTTEAMTTTTTATETTTPTSEQAEAPPPDPWAETPETQALLGQAQRYARIARRWRALMGKPRPHIRWPATPFASLLERRQWLVTTWRAKAARARWRGTHPPHRRAWLCIHSYEGSWRDPYAPYYGGLQMDLTFQRQYGARLLRRKGTANNWSPLEQMWVAERALRAGRGFYPWPVSARRCGLI
jgi:hypothetical protein